MTPSQPPLLQLLNPLYPPSVHRDPVTDQLILVDILFLQDQVDVIQFFAIDDTEAVLFIGTEQREFRIVHIPHQLQQIEPDN